MQLLQRRSSCCHQLHQLGIWQPHLPESSGRRLRARHRSRIAGVEKKANRTLTTHVRTSRPSRGAEVRLPLQPLLGAALLLSACLSGTCGACSILFFSCISCISWNLAAAISCISWNLARQQCDDGALHTKCTPTEANTFNIRGGEAKQTEQTQRTQRTQRTQHTHTQNTTHS